MQLISKLKKLLSQKSKTSKEVSLKISPALEEFVESEVLPGLNITPAYFWTSFENILDKPIEIIVLPDDLCAADIYMLLMLFFIQCLFFLYDFAPKYAHHQGILE